MEDVYNELVGWAREIVSMWCAWADCIVTIDVVKDLGIKTKNEEGEKGNERTK